MPKPTDPEKQKYMFTDDIKFLQKAVVRHPQRKDLFLALRRSPNSFARPNDWDLPGGNVLYGELHENSLRKEISEETGLGIEGTLAPIQFITNYDEEKKVYYFFAGFICSAVNATVVLSDEHSEYCWVSKEDFANLKPAQYLVDLVERVFEK